MLPFNCLKYTADRENYWFHCFTADKHFHRLYNRFEDLIIDFEFLVEVKGLTSPNPSQISKQIWKASQQIEKEHSKYPEEERLPAKIVLISWHTDFEVGFHAITEGYKEAKRKDYVHFKTELWINDEIHILNEEE